MTGSASKSLQGIRSHNQWLVLIAMFKFAQALLFVAIGVGARRLLHKDIGDELYALADHLRFDPESRFVNFILEKATLVHDAQLRQIGFVAFCYAGIGIAEGIGLYLERMWGEFLTLAITASFLPWEIFEVYRRVTWPRISLLAINILVFLYLIKVVTDRGRHKVRGRR
ncbi:MAG TPA: DUF2127 domain-containing protein [Terracidiphilus sp.]|jgi:uncharacterized membrane protein (DUF2068 family)